MRSLRLALALLPAAALALSSTAYAHSEDPLAAGWGTPVIDGVRGAGEWDDVVPRPVFTGLAGSLFYVLNDGTNLYLAIWVPDPTVTINDQLRVRFDNDHDGVNTENDDELGVVGSDIFFDLHFASGFWNQGDPGSHGAGAAGEQDGGGFYEMSHPLDSGDVHDLSISPGDTVGLCIRFNSNGLASSTNVYPYDCMNSINQQSLYVDLATATGTVDAAPSAGTVPRLVAYPNPARLGSAMEIRYAVPAGGAQVEISLHSITGAKVASLASRREAGGLRSLRWAIPTADASSFRAGVYFLRVRYDGVRAETRSLLLR